MLRDSCQNRSNICLSILWAVGQGGYQNLMEGLKGNIKQNMKIYFLFFHLNCLFDKSLAKFNVAQFDYEKLLPFYM